MRNRRLLKQISIVIAVIMIIAMIIFTILPLFVY